MAEFAEAGQFKAHEAAGPEGWIAEVAEGDDGGVVKSGVGGEVLGETVEQFDDVIGGVESGQVAAEGVEAFNQVGLGEQVEGFGSLMEQDDVAEAQGVERGSERGAETASAFGQGGDFAKLAAVEGQDAAGFEDVDRPKHKRAGANQGHGAVVMGAGSRSLGGIAAAGRGSAGQGSFDRGADFDAEAADGVVFNAQDGEPDVADLERGAFLGDTAKGVEGKAAEGVVVAFAG